MMSIIQFIPETRCVNNDLGLLTSVAFIGITNEDTFRVIFLVFTKK